MVNFASIAAAALLACSTSAAAIAPRAKTYTAPSGTGNFSLIALAYSGDMKLSGLFPGGVHSGAGADALELWEIGGIGGPYGYNFNTTTGDIYLPDTGAPYTWRINFNGFAPDSLVPGGSPAGYNFMGMDLFDVDAGFEFDAMTNRVMESSYEGKVLAACPWEMSYGKTVGLMWRDSGAARNGSCADVHLKALFAN